MNEGTRIFLGILCLAAAALLAVFGGRRIWAYIIFEKHPRKTKKGGAILQDVEQKDNVHVGIRRPFFVKRMAKAVYAYTVDGKVYYIKATLYFTTKQQTPKFVPVVYITAHPELAYIDDLGTEDLKYVLYGGLFLFWAMLLIFVALTALGVIA